MSVGVQSRGPKCANLVNGSCGFAGGRCIDGASLPGCASPFHCNLIGTGVEPRLLSSFAFAAPSKYFSHSAHGALE